LHRVLLANPDEELCLRLVHGLAERGFIVDRAPTVRQSLTILNEQDYDALLISHGDMTPELALEQALRCQPGLAVIVIADGCTSQAVRLARLGLADYLPAAASAEQVAASITSAVAEKRRCSRQEEVQDHPAAAALIGCSRAIRGVMETIRLIAPKRTTVLISGPTGTGKELAARLIHALSPRASLPMVTVNCGAIPANLLEAEFFGHVKGGFTGAVGSRVGRFEQANGSTLFLDEIGELPVDLQPKVLRAVQEREFQRVGSSQTIRVDLRIIAATNCDLVERTRRGEFREDLYYRLNVVPIVMPSLAGRPQDLCLLAEHFLAKVCRQEGIPLKRISQATLDRLLQYHWPGNVRQLENAVEKAIVLSGDCQDLYPSDFSLPAPDPSDARGEPLGEIRLPPGGIHLDALINRLESSLMEQALQRTEGNKKRAADMLGLKRTTLSAKLRKR